MPTLHGPRPEASEASRHWVLVNTRTRATRKSIFQIIFAPTRSEGTGAGSLLLSPFVFTPEEGRNLEEQPQERRGDGVPRRGSPGHAGRGQGEGGLRDHRAAGRQRDFQLLGAVLTATVAAKCRGITTKGGKPRGWRRRDWTRKKRTSARGCVCCSHTTLPHSLRGCLTVCHASDHGSHESVHLTRVEVRGPPAYLVMWSGGTRGGRKGGRRRKRHPK